VSENEERRAPSAKAAAASRARRIGGRNATTPPVARAPKQDVAAEAEVEVRESETAETVGATESPAPSETTEPAATTSLTKSSTATKTQPPLVRKKPEQPEAAEARSGTSDNAWLVWLPTALLSVAALVFAVLIGVDAASDNSASGASATKQTAKLRETVLAAAKQCVAQANSYDYRTMDASEAKAQACSTGKYKVDNKNTFEKSLKPKVAKVHATQSFQTDVAGVENVSEDGKTWKILLFGQSHAVNDGTGKEGRYDPVAIDVTMTKVGSKWLISELIPV
jgi:hypothetical protein